MPAFVIGNFLLYCVINAFTPGPGNILALNTVTNYGWKGGKRLFFGIFAGYYAVQIICALFVCGIGAYKARDPHISGNVVNVLDFLRGFKKDAYTNELIGKAVAVIGGGNTAMDAARAAKRIEGVEKVTVVYRRTKKYMPADEEEFREALAAGVGFVELAAPVEQKDGKLICTVMKLGEPDASGRRSPVPTDETGRVPFLTEIDGLKVYNIGDSLRGPSTVVECIADAQKAADAIIGEKHLIDIPLEAYPTPKQAIENKRTTDPITLTPILSRCLSCDTVCENCVSVCPNRANTVVVLPDGRREILHLDRLCNECGNCKSFCPYSSAPYLDKLTLFEDEESFNVSSQKGFLILGESCVRVRLDQVEDVDLDKPNDLPKDVEVLILTVMKNIALYR